MRILLFFTYAEIEYVDYVRIVQKRIHTQTYVYRIVCLRTMEL